MHRGLKIALVVVLGVALAGTSLYAADATDGSRSCCLGTSFSVETATTENGPGLTLTHESGDSIRAAELSVYFLPEQSRLTPLDSVTSATLRERSIASPRRWSTQSRYTDESVVGSGDSVTLAAVPRPSTVVVAWQPPNRDGAVDLLATERVVAETPTQNTG